MILTRTKYERSRKIVGWAKANRLRAELVLDALEMAVGPRRPKGVIHHNDSKSIAASCPRAT
jgi:putative transposase